MTTLGPPKDPSPDKGALTDIRTVVIVLLACALSFGTGMSVAMPIMASMGTGLGVLAGLSTGGATAVVLVQVLHALIRADR